MQLQNAKNIRNLAIVAHIDHGKTTLIDSIFRAAQTFAAHTQVAERVMASVPVFISGDKLTAGHVAPDSVRQEYGCCLCGVAVD